MVSMLLALVAASGADTVVDSIFRRQAVQDAEIACVSYRGRMRYTETDLRSGDAREVECERLILVRHFDQQRHEFEDVRVNGQQLEGAERERQIKQLRSKGIVARDMRMPFFLETRHEYDYQVSGPDTWQGMPIWYVEFTPIRPTSRHISGFARVLAGSFDVVSLEFVPCRLPFVVTAARVTLDYARVHGYWLPVRFRMDMDLRLAVVVELMRRRIRVEDDYWDYRLNSDVPAGPEDDE